MADAPAGFSEDLGLEVHEVGEDGRALVAIEAGDRHLNPGGTVHGGVIATLVDTAMGRAVATLIEDDEVPVTIEMKVNYLEPGQPGRLEAWGEVVRHGRLVIVARAEVTRAGDGEAVAEAIGTFISRPRG